ncbi:MAG: hypothetical protein KDK70_15300 [Myxococcales bacterium]|nr:hypothetical protein [Myxococcales bacterium]
MRRIGSSLLLALGLAACGDDLPDPPANTQGADGTSTGSGALDSTTTSAESSTGDGTVTTTTTTTTHGGGTFGEVDDCQLSGDCPGGQFCVAPFDESLGPEGKGLNECVAECVGLMDEAKWCADAAACCDPAAECTDRGYCVLPEDSTGEGSTGDTTGTSSTG